MRRDVLAQALDRYPSYAWAMKMPALVRAKNTVTVSIIALVLVRAPHADVTPGNAAQSKGFLSEKRQSGPTDDFEQQHRVSARAGGRRLLPDVPIAEQHFESAKEARPPSGRSITHLCGRVRAAHGRCHANRLRRTCRLDRIKSVIFGERFLQKVGLDIPHGNRPETRSCKMAGSIDLAG